MKLMRTEDAIGQVLCHDITQIIPGVKKGPVFQKGHIIAPEDVPVLLSVGKEHVYIWEKDDTRFHENEAARILCEMSRNDYMDASEPSEGKIELTAQVDGLFTLDRQRLYAVNSLGEMMIATRHAGPVKKGDKLAGMRVIPLVIEKEKMAEARETAGNSPLLTLTPYRTLKVGLVTTGSEVYYGRIQDQFTPVIKAKLAEYGAEVTHHVLLPDDHAAVTEKIKEFLADGVDMVLCTGGMSVDPDDKTPLAIKNAGVNVVTYGAPVLPGAMFLLSYTDQGTDRRLWRGRPLPELQGLHLAQLRFRKRSLNGMDNHFTHVDAAGNARMVDVGEKAVTHRTAVAVGRVTMSPECFAAVAEGRAKKGDVLGVAQVAGIMATKRTSDLIPLCHTLLLTKSAVEFTLHPEEHSIEAECTVRCEGQTGVEMEALTGVSVALLTVYDMCKAIDKRMTLGEIHLVEKHGGKSGDFYFEEQEH